MKLQPLKVYACYSLNHDIRMASSSGAVFSSLAEYILDRKGVVYGVAMTQDCYSAEFIAATSKEELPRLRGSKYLQAKVGNAFSEVKNNLSEGKLVLFTGTGCQVSGLKNYLGKEYENLICADVICHGVPSPALWKAYVKYQEEKNNGKLKKVNFRCKDKGWTDFGMSELSSDAAGTKESSIFISKDRDSYMQMFLRNYALRPSCYECVAKEKKDSDLSIADFWGIETVAPELNDGDGTSLVLIRTQRGEEIFEQIVSGLKIKEVSYETGIKGNPAEYESAHRPQERGVFYQDFSILSYKKLAQKYASPNWDSLKYATKKEIKKVLRIIQNVRGGGTKQANSISDYGLLLAFTNDENK